MNVMLYRHGEDCLLVDAGLMFPRAEHPGIDVILPDLSYLADCGRLHAVIATHGHEDHIGAIPHLLERHDVPVYGTAYTLDLIAAKLADRGQDPAGRLHTLPEDGTPSHFGPFTVETVAVAHSIPLSKMLVLHTPVGVVVHTADFKLDPDPPDGSGSDLSRLSRLGDAGVLALLADSTNADRPGFTASERAAASGLAQVIAGARGRVLVSTFASNVHRLQQLVRLAVAHDRKLAVVGSSLESHVAVAERHGQLTIPRGVRLSPEQAMELPSRRVLLAVTGSQGEAGSALARIAVGQHRSVEIDEGDMVIHSARIIPGNGDTVGRLFDNLLRRGARVVQNAPGLPVHVSGHPSSQELRLLLQILRPRYLVPIHGDYRQLHAHAAIGRDAGMAAEQVTLAESGDLLALDERTIERVGRVPSGRLFVDRARDEIDPALIRERREMAFDGALFVMVRIDGESRTVAGYPVIVSRGFGPGQGDESPTLAEAGRRIVEALNELPARQRADRAALEATVSATLRRFLRRREQRQPLIVPIILER